MSEEKTKVNDSKFRLPERITGTAHLVQATRELEKVDDFLYQTHLRTPGRPVALPKSNKILDDLAEVNNVNLLNEASRKKLLEVLEQLAEKAPVIHISFASEPSNDFLEKVVGWCRVNLHPYVLVNVGLQPSAIVGCEVRTTNKVFDMSLRNKFEEMRKVLLKKLEEVND